MEAGMFIAVFLIGAFIGWSIGMFTEQHFFEYLKFKKQQEFEKEKYYSEYAERYNKGGK